MLYKKSLLTVFLFLSLSLPSLLAQNVVPAAGGNATGSGGTLSYTVGQVVYSSILEPNGSVSQGVQQPFEISFASGINPNQGITLKCSAYPNPAVDFLILKVDNYDITLLSYTIYDINGKLLKAQILESNETRIDMSHLVPATYFLKILQRNIPGSSQNLVEFKIIKN